MFCKLARHLRPAFIISYCRLRRFKRSFWLICVHEPRQIFRILFQCFFLGKGGKPIDCRIEDSKRTGEDFAAAKEALGDLAETEEDVMSYICFPAQAEQFLKDRKAEREKRVTYTIVEA